MTHLASLRNSLRAATILWVWPLLAARLVSGVEIEEISWQERPHFRVKSASATWYYDRRGGGFSRLVDRDGQDWIAFKKDPLSKFPASAAAGYRGLPNSVFVGPDKGAGHPGFDQCHSRIVDGNAITTESNSGRWAWQWTFTNQGAHFEMLRADDEHRWWFLYEGPIAGTFTPTKKYWGTDRGGPRREVPGSGSQIFEHWHWIYFGDERVKRILMLAQHDQDSLPDTLWYLGSEDGGSASSPDGMVVFGFGRGPKTTPQLKGSGHRFSVWFVEQPINDHDDHERLAKQIRSSLQRFRDATKPRN